MFPLGTRYLPALRAIDMNGRFIIFSLCFVPPYWSEDQDRSPKPGHSYWINRSKAIDFITVLLSICFYPIRATKWHISSKVSAAELCISSGRKPTYRARLSLAYRQKRIAGTNNQYSRFLRVGAPSGRRRRLGALPGGAAARAF